MIRVLVAHGILLILTYNYPHVNGVKLHTYTRSNDTDIICASGLAPLTTVRSRLECSKMCGTHDQCLGFFFNSLDKSCTISDVVIHGSVCTSSLGTSYYYRDRTSYGDDCIDDTDCFGEDVLCWEGTCKCTPGFSLHPDTYTCHSECTTYGDTFTTYRNRTLALAGSNDYPNSTLADCLNHCLGDGCRTSRYHYPSLTCRTDIRTPHTDPGTLTFLADIDLFVRDCASDF